MENIVFIFVLCENLVLRFVMIFVGHATERIKKEHNIAQYRFSSVFAGVALLKYLKPQISEPPFKPNLG